MRFRSRKPAHGFDDNERGEREKKSGFGEGGERLEFAVAVMVLFVGGPARRPHGEIGEHRRSRVEQGMTCLGQERERAGEQAGSEFGERQCGACADRSERGRLFQRLCIRHVGTP